MAKVTAWKCENTGTLFGTEEEFRAHLCHKRYRRFVEKRRETRRSTLEERVGVLRQLTSFAEIEAWLNANGKLLFEHAYERFSDYDKKRATKNRTKHPHYLGEVRFENLRWEAIATTHHAPFGRRTTGFGKEPAERYFGWRGKISFVQKNFPTFASEIFRNTGINTGSGGGGDRLEYQLVIFAEDFPDLMEAMHREGLLDPAIPFPLPLPSPAP